MIRASPVALAATAAPAPAEAMDSRLTTLATAKFAVLELATVAGKQAGRSHAQAAQQQQGKAKKQKAQAAPQKQQQQTQQTQSAQKQQAQQAPQCNPQESKAEEIEAFILQTLARDGVINDTWELTANGYDHQEVVGCMKSLLADGYVTAEPLEHQFLTLTDEGKDVMLNGSVELRVFNAVPEGGISVAELQSAVGAEVAKLGMGPCMKNKWLKKQGDTLVRVVSSVEDTTAQLLARVHEALGDMGSISDEDQKNLKRRKLITQVVRKSFRVAQGPEFAPVRQKKASDLTKQMLETGEWQTVPFKKYTFNAMGAPVMGGNFHPLLKVRAEIRRTLMNMGFEEMPTNKWVESSFWNFDALFQPQSHPARDAHDTFFIQEPMHCNSVPEDYYEIVKQTHERGGFGSIGYGYDFKREEATKNLLRTHTTAVSAQMLYKLANQEGGFQPKRYFSIDRVFRNETMDSTHLCEFHQVEGLVADRNLSLGDLIGTIKTFFEQIGITEVRFKPAYNPYTEPSMEIFGFHPELKKWTEIGNSGIFRPEMLRPMGLPEDVRVIAWGLGLERPTMIKYRISNIRDLFGHKAALNLQRQAPVARFRATEA